MLILATYLAIMHQIKGVLGAANAHVYCPFGGLESLYQFLATGGYIPKIMPATMILLLVTVILAIVLNRAFCGWICPLGTLQMVFDRIGRFFRIKKVQVPDHVEKYLHYLKYVGLVIILYFSWKIGELIYSPYDPWAAYAHIAAGFEELYAEFLIGTIFLLIALIGSLWLPNNFCRYFCPMGAILAILAKLSPTRIHRKADTCINCKRCDRVCPVQIEISTQPTVKTTECLSCGDCIAICPVENTLFYSVRGKARIKWLAYGVVTLVIFFGSVFVAQQTGIWKTSYSTAAEALMDASGEKNPANIKGSLTLEMVSQEFNVPIDAFIRRFNLPSDVDPTAMLRDIVHPLNLETEDIRLFVEEYLEKGEAAVVTPTPELETQPTAEQPAVESVEPTPGETPTSEAEPAATKQPQLDIRGKTTIGELLNYGMSKEQFKEITGIDMPEDQAVILKDFAAAQGLDMDTLKAQLIEALQP